MRSGDALLDYGDLLIPVFDGYRDPSTKILNLNAWKEISRYTAKKLISIQEGTDFVIILHYDHQVFRETGADNLAIQALSLLDHVDRLWFLLDVDVLDPTLMPVCFPEPDGLSVDETLTFLSTSIRSKRFMGMSVSCYHPNLDKNLIVIC